MKNALFALLDARLLKRPCEWLDRASSTIKSVSLTMLNSIGCIGLLLALAGDLQAQSREFPFFELTDADLERIDLHDGSIDDWLDVLGDPDLTGLDFADDSEFGLAEYDPSDIDFRVWLAWHDATNRIYVASERADDVYFNEFDRNEHNMSNHDSGLHFAIDGDNGKNPDNRMDGIVDAREYFQILARDSQWYMGISEVFDGGPLLELVNYWNAPLGTEGDWYLHPPYSEAGGGHFGEGPTISVSEFYLTPFDLFVWDDRTGSRVSDLSPGKRVGFRISFVDVEEGGILDGFYSVPPGRDWSTGGWAEGFLVGLGGVLPEDTAVKGITWARIKATFAE
jgi:hypothetical protein